jgi:hypothetical protein
MKMMESFKLDKNKLPKPNTKYKIQKKKKKKKRTKEKEILKKYRKI